MHAPNEWQVGAVVMMDALGFKGIWKTHSPSAVLDRMHLIERSVRRLESLPSANVARELGFRMVITFLSDTVVIACSDTQRPEATVCLATAAAGFAMHAGATDTEEGRTWDVPLAYRGAIAHGRFHVEDRFLLGPAVDEAAEAMNRPEGAFVYLTESARDLYRDYGPRPVATRWPVPLKAEPGASAPGALSAIRTFDTWVVSPFAHDAAGPDDTWDIGRLILSTFDRDKTPGVRQKRDNTEAFLRRAHQEHEARRAAG